jgi:hypothetical protein
MGKESNMENESIPQLQIRVEKLLCKALGREWAPSGFSIITLCEDVAALRDENARLREVNKGLGAMLKAID